jgi:hypothetical protein
MLLQKLAVTFGFLADGASLSHSVEYELTIPSELDAVLTKKIGVLLACTSS